MNVARVISPFKQPLVVWPQLGAESSAPEEESDSLEDVARKEREYLRRRLREELKREPTEQETDEYIQQHTESY